MGRIDGVDEEQLARKFHETYEKLAPGFGYETKAESAVRWEAVPEQNRDLMVATAREVLRWLRGEPEPEPETIRASLSPPNRPRYTLLCLFYSRPLREL